MSASKQKKSFDSVELEKEIELVRKAWGLKKPKYGKLPKWFRLKMPDCVIPYAINDHFGFVEHDTHGEVAIFEPYEMRCDTSKAREIGKAIAIQIGCRYSVSLISYWFPGSTIRISFFQKTNEVTQ